MPYLFYGTLYQLFIAALAIVGGAPVVSTIRYRIALVLQGEGSAMWFLPTMFVASLLFSLTQKWRGFQIMLAALGMVIWLNSDPVNGLAGCLFRALPGFAFIVIGFNLYRVFSNQRKTYELAAAIVIHLIAMLANKTVSIASHDTGNPYLYLIESTVGVFVIYQIVLRLNAKKLHRIACIGRYSVVFLCLHGFIIQVIRLIDYKTFNFFPCLGWAEGIVLSASVILIIYMCIPWLIKYFSWTFGIKNTYGSLLVQKE